MDFVISVIVIVLALAGVVDAVRLIRLVEPGPVFKGDVGPGSYLLLLSAGLAMSGAIKLIKQYRSSNKTSIAETRQETAVSFHLASILTISALYAVAMPILGYPLSSACFFCAVYYANGIRPWPRVFLIGISVATCFYIVFSMLIQVQLPKGWLLSHVFTF